MKTAIRTTILRILFLTVTVCFLQHHVLDLHETDLRAALIFIQLHGNILYTCLCLGNGDMLKSIDTAPGLFNLRSHELTGFFDFGKPQHLDVKAKP